MIDVTSEGSSDDGRKRKGVLGVLPLVVLVFYGVSGGPFGIEAAVGAGGSFLCIVGFIVIPLVWAVPEALVTAELSTTFPEPAGFVAWVEVAFGPFWGFMEGYLSWISGVTDNSLYPLLMYEYLATVYPWLAGSPVKQPALLAMVVGLVWLNYKGIEVVGRTATVLCVFSMFPFVVLTVLGIPKMDVGRLFEGPPAGGVDWRLFLNVMFWNFNYWDSAAVFAGEVGDPGTAFPKALGYAVVLVVLAYSVPTIVGMAATKAPYTSWTDGYFSEVGEELGGYWLGTWILLAAGISNIGMFLAELSADSYQLLGMSERGMLPKFLSKRSKQGSPSTAILCSFVGILFLITFDFHSVIEMLNLLYCLAEVLEFAAFIKLRVAHADLPRPYKVPLSTTGCCVLLLVPSLLILTLMSVASTASWWVCCTTTLLGIALYHVLSFLRAASILDFHDKDGFLPRTGTLLSASEITPLLSFKHSTGPPNTDHDFTGKRGRSPAVRSLSL